MAEGKLNAPNLALSFSSVHRGQSSRWLRTLKLVVGDRATTMEAVLVSAEKVTAAEDAFRWVLRGASIDNVVGAYRSSVRANKKRLSS